MHPRRQNPGYAYGWTAFNRYAIQHVKRGDRPPLCAPIDPSMRAHLSTLMRRLKTQDCETHSGVFTLTLVGGLYYFVHCTGVGRDNLPARLPGLSMTALNATNVHQVPSTSRQTAVYFVIDPCFPAQLIGLH